MGEPDTLTTASEEGSPSLQDKTKAARGVFWLGLTAVANKGSQILTLLVLARFLDPKQFGVISVAALTYNILQAFSNMGIPDAMIYLKDRSDEVARTALTMITGAALGASTVMWVTAGALGDFFHSPAAAFVIRGFAIALPFSAASLVPLSLLSRSFKYSTRTVTDTIPSLVGTVITIGLVIDGHFLYGLVIGEITQSALQLTMALILGERHLFGWDTAVAKEIIGFGGPVAMNSMATLILLNVDYVIIGHTTPSRLGYYSLAFRICFTPIASIAFVINGAAYPYLCRLGSKEDLGKATASLVSMVNAIVLPAYAGIALFAGDIVLLGHKWAPAVSTIRLLAIYGIAYTISGTIKLSITVAGRPKYGLYATLTHIVLLAIAIESNVRAGIAWVGLDQALVAIFGIFLNSYWASKFAGLKRGPMIFKLALPLPGVALMASVMFLGRSITLFNADTWRQLAVLAPLAGLGFLAVSSFVMPDLFRQAKALFKGEGAGIPPPPDAPIGSFESTEPELGPGPEAITPVT